MVSVSHAQSSHAASGPTPTAISRRELSAQIATAVNAYARQNASPKVQRQVAQLSARQALEWFNRSQGITSVPSTAGGPLTVSGKSVRALRRYYPGFGTPGARPPATSPTLTARNTDTDRGDTASPATRPQRTAPRGLQQPASNGVRSSGSNRPQQAEPERRGFLERLFGTGRSSGGTGEAAARAELMRQTGGRLRPNHAYVVQLDRDNTGSNAARLKGQTYVFSMDRSGNVTCRGSFNSSSQPTTHAPASGMNAPYILDGMYSMSTAITGTTQGFAINAHRAYRDTNKNGMIDASEQRVVGTGAIMFHTAALGSAGCQIIDASDWMDFASTVQRYGTNGATYVLRRT